MRRGTGTKEWERERKGRVGEVERRRKGRKIVEGS